MPVNSIVVNLNKLNLDGVKNFAHKNERRKKTKVVMSLQEFHNPKCQDIIDSLFQCSLSTLPPFITESDNIIHVDHFNDKLSYSFDLNDDIKQEECEELDENLEELNLSIDTLDYYEDECFSDDDNDYDYISSIADEFDDQLLSFKSMRNKSSFEVRADYYRRSKNKNKKEKIRRQYIHHLEEFNVRPRFRISFSPMPDSIDIQALKYSKSVPQNSSSAIPPSYSAPYSYQPQSLSYEQQLQNAINESKSSNAALECGLNARNLESLLYRELTADDYLLLLQLDESVPKKVLEKELIDSFPSFVFNSPVNKNNDSPSSDDSQIVIVENNEDDFHSCDVDHESIVIGSIYDEFKEENTKESSDLMSEEKDEIAMIHCDSCSICLCEFENGDMLTKIPICGHIFHYDCISQWLSKSSTKCPLDGLTLID